ncbi:hypothetical protein [Campylobacter sp. RM16192]|uniref:hypothetical protein n=1 Tax=Campylobacter sp. RM16192 TaxID=1660080 RepID=UPI001451A46D|nr:hypothetical protein [Campylobacter sp. RM16192]QCD52518.1 hypothetical protein CDOMC_0895 [Campylobacter sp. RM16192]
MEDFKEKYKEVTKELLRLSVEEDTPYKATLDFLDQKINELAVSNEYKVKMLSAMLPNLVVPFTTSAMQLGIELTHKHLAFNTELDTLKEQGESIKLKNDELREHKDLKKQGLEKQNELLGAQIAKLKKETALAGSQQQAIDKQVSDNRVIKVGAMMQDFVTNNHAHSINVPKSMIEYFFNILQGLIRNDLPGLQPPTDFDMPKK